VAEVVVVIVAVILEDEDPLEGHGSYGGRHSGFDKGPRQCRHFRRNNHILRSAGRNLVALKGHSWLIPTLLPLVILLMLLQPLLLVLLL